MATYIKSLVDSDGNTIYPQSKTNAIYDENNKNLQNILDDMKVIVISSTQPINLNNDDLWYKIIT